MSPFFILVAVVLRLTGEGEILFFQERIGRNGRKFKIIKFATMLKNSPNMGNKTITVSGDPRILPFGHVLRKTKFNELPQLLNIFWGQMSIVGPRPLTDETLSSYSPEIQTIVTSVKPGLSGIGSIVFRGEEKILNGENASREYYDRVIAPYKGELEKWFIKNNSLTTYILVILVTAWTVLFPSSKMVWKVFKNLPEPARELQNLLG